MKTIDEAAREYAGINKDRYSNIAHTYNKYDIAEAFEIGVEFAQRWIPVDDEFPKEGQRVLTSPCENPEESDISFAFYKLGRFVSPFRSPKIRKDNNGDIESIHYEREKLDDTTHWRPIEIK